jgi:hypothetical protein
MRHCLDRQFGAKPCFLIMELGVCIGLMVVISKGIGRVFSEKENYVIMLIDTEKWFVIFGCNKVFAVIPKMPENLCKHIIQLKKCSIKKRERKIVMPNLSGTF